MAVLAVPVMQDQGARFLCAVLDAAALFGVRQEIPIFVGDLELVVTSETMLDVIQVYRVVGVLLVQRDFHIGTIPFEILAQFHRLIPVCVPVVAVTI